MWYRTWSMHLGNLSHSCFCVTPFPCFVCNETYTQSHIKPSSFPFGSVMLQELQKLMKNCILAFFLPFSPLNSLASKPNYLYLIPSASNLSSFTLADSVNEKALDKKLLKGYERGLVLPCQEFMSVKCL